MNLNRKPVVNLDDYQYSAIRTAVYPGAQGPIGLLYTALGLGNEAGEVLGKVKKLVRDDNSDILLTHRMKISEEKKAAIAGELGDVLWYAAMVATELGLSLNDIAYENIQKLADRKERGVLTGDGDNR